MRGFDRLNNEQKLLILLSRISYTDSIESDLREIVNKNIDWYCLICYAIKNKVIGFVYYNLDRFGLLDKIPKQIIRIMRFYYIGNSFRNEVYVREFQKIEEKFQQEGVLYAPLKGIFFLTDLYKDMSGRALNDIDCMIDYNQYKIVKQIMQAEGYAQTEYDGVEKVQKPISRKKAVFWNLHMNNSYPFRREIGNVFCERVNFDFCFGIEKNNRKIVSDMLGRMYRKNQLNNYDFFIHLCAHLYKEAVNDMWIWSGSDINLVKFTDVREFSMKYMSVEDFFRAINLAREEGGNILKSIHFTMYYLKEIFDDGYEEDVINYCNIDNEEYLEYFNEDTKFKKNFWERLFAYSNVDELKMEPQYLQLDKEVVDEKNIR